MLIDTHVHLDMIQSPADAVRRARDAGVSKIVAVGTHLKSNRKTLDLGEQFPETVLPAIGYHPWAVVEKEVDETLRFVDAHLRSCIALGEVGLDYKIKVPKKIQQQVFESLLKIAAKHEKPVNVHSRYSFERAFAMLRDAGVSKAVFHWYSGPLDMLERIINAGYFISATPALAYSSRHQAAVKRTPIEHMLIETDAPEAYQGKTSEPATLVQTLEHLAWIKNVSIEEAARSTTENARFFYGIEAEKEGR
ncbi:MAG: TatD family hydrolase [Desulfobacterales bacterium]